MASNTEAATSSEFFCLVCLGGLRKRMWFNDITGVYLICLFCFLQSMSFALSFVPCDVSGFNVENPGRILLCIIHYRSRTHGYFKMCTWFSIPADFHCCKGNVGKQYCTAEHRSCLAQPVWHCQTASRNYAAWLEKSVMSCGLLILWLEHHAAALHYDDHNVNRMQVGVNCATKRDKGYAGCAYRSG